jgi:serine/threonine protein phosphatase PrpC
MQICPREGERQGKVLRMMNQPIEMRTLPRIAAGRARGGRPTQQDELICLHDPAEQACLLVLADGMGGDGAGELAAEGVIHIARRLWEQGHWRRQPAALFLETLCQDAHAELRRRGQALARGEPHSTIVALLLKGRHASWVHVGDSRLYRFQGRRCLDRTEDHSLVQLKVRRGELSDEQAADDPDQHRLLRGLGGPQPPQVDHGGAMLRQGQAFVLCSDGVWERLSTRELGRLARRHNQPEALREALTLAMERGGEQGDNVALILARVGWTGGWRQRASRLWSAVVGGATTRRGEVLADGLVERQDA